MNNPVVPTLESGATVLPGPEPNPIGAPVPEPQVPGAPGPESKITVALVKRVSKRIARGIPIKIALSSEPITHAAYKKHLQRHPELRAIQAAAKLKFLDSAFDLILSRPGPLLRWLLERRHSDIFAAPREKLPAQKPDPAPEKPTQTITGVSQEALEEARRNAQNRQ